MRAGLKLSKLKSQVKLLPGGFCGSQILHSCNLFLDANVGNSCQDDPNNCQLDWFTLAGMVNLISKHPFTLLRAIFWQISDSKFMKGTPSQFDSVSWMADSYIA